MSNLEWYEVKFKENKVLPDLYNYSTARMGDQIIVFGGMNNDYQKQNNLYSIDLQLMRTDYTPPKEQ